MDSGFPGMDAHWKPSECKSDNPLTLAKLESSNYIMLLGAERIENGKLRKLLDELKDELKRCYGLLDKAEHVAEYYKDSVTTFFMDGSEEDDGEIAREFLKALKEDTKK